ncbi:MAG: hypothetical protein J2P18_04435 [Nocardia sp.]|nr:hypothetical protein [Nocardia sp.]
MRDLPTALGWINPDVSTALDWDRASVCRLARKLGYMLEWFPDDTVLDPVCYIAAADVGMVIAPTPNHFDALILNRLMHMVSVEIVRPRASFDRWFGLGNWA